jgi:two-component system response regulator BaeR
MENTPILVVEDDAKIAALLKDYLEQAGFSVSVLGRGDAAVAEVRAHPPDLILLDVMLPGKDGMTVCREVRAFSSVPIVMITARVEEIDRLLGLELGADDYICKPFSPREVVARVKAILRRAAPAPVKERLVAGPITLDAETRQVTVSGAQLHLTPSEFSLLRILMARPGRVFSRSDLIARVQGYEFDGYDRTIDSHIKNLRKKIAGHLPGETVIRTAYGVGYAFHAPGAG